MPTPFVASKLSFVGLLTCVTVTLALSSGGATDSLFDVFDTDGGNSLELVRLDFALLLLLLLLLLWLLTLGLSGIGKLMIINESTFCSNKFHESSKFKL